MLPLLWQTCVKISGGAFRDFVSAMEGQTVVGFLPQPPKTLPPRAAAAPCAPDGGLPATLKVTACRRIASRPTANYEQQQALSLLDAGQKYGGAGAG